MEAEPENMNTDPLIDSKKRKPETSLSDLKRQQLADARLRKQQKQLQRENELSALKDKLNETESKLNQLDQKLTNSEVDKDVKSQIESSEKKQKVVVLEDVKKPEPGFTWLS